MLSALRDVPRPRGHVESIELENFKSYRGRHVVGPFRRFQCIVGPNGSGKSNLMDAMAFALGVQSRRMRASNLRSLICKAANLETEVVQASVTINFDFNGTKCQCSRLIIVEPGDKRGEKSEYRVDGKHMTYTDYVAFLATHNILVNTRNFLVFQNVIQDVGQSDPLQLTNRLEAISGSLDYKEKCQELEETVRVKSIELREKQSELKTYEGVKQSLHHELEKVNRYERLKKDLKRQEVRYLASRMFIRKAQSEFIFGQNSELTDLLKIQAPEAKSLQMAVREACKEKDELETAEQETNEQELTLSEAREKNLTKLKMEKSAVDNFTSTITAMTKKQEEAYHKLEAAKEKDYKSERELEEAAHVKIEHAIRDLHDLKPKLTTLQQVEYERLIKEDREQNAKIVSEMNRASEEVEDTKLAIKASNNKIQREEALIVKHRTDADGAEKSLLKLDVDLSGLAGLIKQKEAEAEVKIQQLASQDEIRAEVTKRIDEISNRIQHTRANERELKQKEDLHRFIREIQVSFRGVHGLFQTLVKTNDTRFEAAVEPALGRYNEAIIIDFNQDKRAIIDLARKRRLRVSLIALEDNHRPSTANEYLRPYTRNRDDTQLLTDVLTYDPRFRELVYSKLGDTLVCSTYDVAERVAYQDKIEAKIVTVHGETILKNGNVVAGGTGKSRDVTQISAAEKIRLQDEFDELKRKLNEELNVTILRTEVHDAKNSVINIEHNIKECQNGQTAQQNRKTTANEELHRLIISLKKNKRELVDIEAVHAKAVKAHKIASAKHVKQSADLYKALSSELGVNNIHQALEEFKMKHLDLISDLRSATKRVNVIMRQEINHKTKLEDLANESKASEEKIKKHRRHMLAATEKHRTIAAKNDAIKVELTGVRERKLELSQQIKRAKDRLEDRSSHFTAIKDELLQMKATIRSNKDKVVEHLAMIDELTIEGFRVHNLPLCLVGEPDEVDDDKLQAWRREKFFTYQRQIAAVGTEMDEAALATLNEWAVDYAKIIGTSQMEQISTAVNTDSLEHYEDDTLKPLAKDISKLKLDVEGKKPMNLNVKTKLDSTKEELTKLKRDIRTRSIANDGFRKELSRVQKKRRDLFMKAYKHVQSEVKRIYSRLTTIEATSGVRDAQPQSGECRLSLDAERADEPYKLGLNFSARPTNKQWINGSMRLLSGGEKTMAAMSLVMAFQSFRPSPFVVLDEVDAALDQVNVKTLSKYLREENYQCVVISLKELLYAQSDALIGVYRDGTSSRTLTLDLRKENTSSANDDSNITTTYQTGSGSNSFMSVPKSGASTTSDYGIHLPRSWDLDDHQAGGNDVESENVPLDVVKLPDGHAGRTGTFLSQSDDSPFASS